MPTASMQEILPAARLLSRATALTPSDYERAKAAFLSGVDASRLAAQVPRPGVPSSLHHHHLHETWMLCSEESDDTWRTP